MTITTQTATTYLDTDSGNTFLAVPWQIIDDDGTTVLSEGSQSFDLTASSDDIKAFLSQALSVYQADLAISTASADLQSGLDNATVVAADVSNLTLS